MGIKNTVESLYLALMLRWENTAPPDRQQGILDGDVARNTQISRMAYILKKIAAGQDERIYNALSRYSRRKDGKSYISRDSSWMSEPYPLAGDWYFEGCTSLKQKQEILQYLTNLNLSPALVACVDDFVAGKSVVRHIPSDEEAEEILRHSFAIEKLSEDRL